jgi:hypothetical protein
MICEQIHRHEEYTVGLNNRYNPWWFEALSLLFVAFLGPKSPSQDLCRIHGKNVFSLTKTRLAMLNLSLAFRFVRIMMDPYRQIHIVVYDNTMANSRMVAPCVHVDVVVLGNLS